MKLAAFTRRRWLTFTALLALAGFVLRSHFVQHMGCPVGDQCMNESAPPEIKDARNWMGLSCHCHESCETRSILDRF